MEYQLYEASNPGQSVAKAQLADDFAAERWAREWASGHATADNYRIEGAGGGFAARLFKTVAGQWYIMRQ